MTNGHSLDLRRHVIRAVEAGASYPSGGSALQGLGILGDPVESRNCAKRAKVRRSLGVATAATEPDLTLSEITAKFEDAVSYRPPTSVVHAFFKRRGVTRKERRRSPPNRAGRT